MFRFLATSGRSLSTRIGDSFGFSNLLVLVGLGLLFPTPGVEADNAPPSTLSTLEDVDLRSSFAAKKHFPNAAQRRAADRWRRSIPELEIRHHPHFGTARTVSNRTGALTPPDAREPLEIARTWLDAERDLLGLDAFDLADFVVTDHVKSSITGSHHLYLQQHHLGLPIYNARLQLNFDRERRLISVHNSFVAGLATSIENAAAPLEAQDAITQAVASWITTTGGTPFSLRKSAPERVRLHHPRLAPAGTDAVRQWLPISAGRTRLVWNVVLTAPDGSVHELNIDTEDARLWTRHAWTRHGASYRVYPTPLPSPDLATPQPPSDGRLLVYDPADLSASPLGWHDRGAGVSTGFLGNNVHAYADPDANDAPPASEPSCSTGLTCDFPLNLQQSPSESTPAALTNAFYWINRVHDIQYHYGFDEAAGNFQHQNFNQGGLGNDAILAEVQDGGDSCNARFSTPPDGTAPRFQLYTCNSTAPSRDSAFDHTVLVHELAHGITARQVGGPSSASCLNNAQQPSEGWSDWFGLVYTAQAGDLGTDTRGFATYLFGQPTDGTGIRPQPYNIDPAINTYTYASIATLGRPHGTGSVWAQALWEMYWTLVDRHGFSEDLADALGGSGNQRALLYVNEGLKHTACSPSFLDARDGILQAASSLYGGADVCTLWQAFADFGLGVDAVSGGPDGLTPSNGFNLPAECQCQPNPIAFAGEDRSICLGESTVLGTDPLAAHTYTWTPGNASSSQLTVSPLETTTFTLEATTTCGSRQESVTVFVDDGSGGGLDEDFESAESGWTATGLWHRVNQSSCAQPAYASATHAFYYGLDDTCTYQTDGATTGTLTSPVVTGLTAESLLRFDFWRRVEGFAGGAFDRTEVEIVSDLGVTTVWARDTTDPSSGSWKDSGPISLEAFAGRPIQVRFRFDSVDGTSNAFTGWFVDNVRITGESPCAASIVLDWSAQDLENYGSGPPGAGRSVIEDAGETLILEGSRWLKTRDRFDISPFTVLEFEFKSDSVGDLHAIGFDDNNETHDAVRLFQIYGRRGWAGAIKPTQTYQAVDSGQYVVFRLPIGEQYSGRQMHLVVAHDGPASMHSTFRNVRLVERPPQADRLDFTQISWTSYADQDGSGTLESHDNGLTVETTGQRWVASETTYTLTPRTVLAFEFQSSRTDGLQAIGFDEDDSLLNHQRLFQLSGPPWSGAHSVENLDSGSDVQAWRTVTVPVGKHYTGTDLRLVLAADGPDGARQFRNVRLYER